jgi:glycosyltransferase involved in cell wall biosynthesis
VRIAFYAPLKSPDHPVASGDRTLARALLAALRAAGHEVETVCRFRSFDAGDPARQARLEGIGGRLADRLAGRLRRGRPRPDLWFTYHLYHKAPDWLGPAVAARLGVPYVVAEASFAPKQAGGRWDLGHRAVARAIGSADLVLQLNPNDAEGVKPLVAAAERLSPLKPFLDTRPFRDAAASADRAAMASLYGLDASVPWLLAVAMMRHDQKLLSYRCLAEALAPLLDLPWRLVVAGGGPAEGQVRAAFAPLADRVDFLGILPGDALPALYAASDLYVWPAVKEAWSMALMEAQAAGVAVVAGRSGGVAAVVADGETGILVPEGDVAAFSAAARRLLETPQERRKMGRAAAARTLREHDLAAAAKAIDERLSRLLRAA